MQVKAGLLSWVVFGLLPAMAFASQSGTLSLSGVVAANNSISITPNGANNTSLNITGGATGVNVASVTEVSNDESGYKITVASTNSGFLQADSNDKTSYQVSYNGGSYITPTTNASTVKTVSSLSQQTSATSQVTVNVTAAPNAMAGTYSDTLTFSIVAN